MIDTGRMEYHRCGQCIHMVPVVGTKRCHSCEALICFPCQHRHAALHATHHQTLQPIHTVDPLCQPHYQSHFHVPYSPSDVTQTTYQHSLQSAQLSSQSCARAHSYRPHTYGNIAHTIPEQKQPTQVFVPTFAPPPNSVLSPPLHPTSPYPSIGTLKEKSKELAQNKWVRRGFKTTVVLAGFAIGAELSGLADVGGCLASGDTIAGSADAFAGADTSAVSATAGADAFTGSTEDSAAYNNSGSTFANGCYGDYGTTVDGNAMANAPPAPPAPPGAPSASGASLDNTLAQNMAVINAQAHWSSLNTLASMPAFK